MRTTTKPRRARKKADARRRFAPRPDLWIPLALICAVFFAYGRALHFDFVTFDDPEYVTANPHVQAGLTLAGVAWAFRSSYAGNWFPITWISHMLDCQWFGLESGWHHLTSLWIHAAGAVAWFLLLKRITGEPGKSALVAFLYAVHPLRVESVVWVAERKDVLSALFWVLTLWAWIRYVSRRSAARYVLALSIFALGLMSKQMLITLPAVLLLLDWWPLGRRPAIVEKVPFFALSLAAAAVTYAVHTATSTMLPFDAVPLGARLENAVVSYGLYPLKMFWPADLAVFYPYSLEHMALPAAAAAVALAAVTRFAVRERTRRPYLLFGWLWYLVTLVPVIGIVQAGSHARADRFTYIPSIGIAIAAVWGLSEAFEGWPRFRVALAGGACAACLALTWAQTGYWRNSESLYRHAIAVTADNYLARFNLASVLEARGATAEAAAELRETVRVRPMFGAAHAELGQLLSTRGWPGRPCGSCRPLCA